jgi:flagellar secretion chaperone FliS
MPDADRSYRRAAVQEASPAGLVVILYDILVDDLQRAQAAIRAADIEQRSRCLKHALLALEILEGSLDLENGGVAAHSLAAFYGYVRHRILDAQFDGDERILADQIALILDVRQSWQTAESASLTSQPAMRPNSVDAEFYQGCQWSA